MTVEPLTLAALGTRDDTRRTAYRESAATMSGAFAMPDTLQTKMTRAVSGVVAPVSSSAVSVGGNGSGTRSIALTVNVMGQPGTNQATLDGYRSVTVEALRDALEVSGG